MEIRFADLSTCAQATGAVIVIDVIRAFTTAAHAFAAGAAEIVPVSTVEEALALRERLPGARIMGEVDALPVTGFDFDNSPRAFDGIRLDGVRLVQRTSSGTQGIARSAAAADILAASFVCAGATARYVRRLAPDQITLVATGPSDAEEDWACAEYLAALLDGGRPDPEPFLARVLASSAGRKFADPELPQYPAEDLPRCAQLDRFDFAMALETADGRAALRPRQA